MIEKQEIRETLHHLRTIGEMTGNGSKKRKEDYLNAYDSSAMRLLLNTAFNPFLRTNIRKVDYAEFICNAEAMYLPSLIDTISKARALNREWKDIVAKHIRSYSELEDRKTLAEVLTKTLSIGMAPKSINKALGEMFIPHSEIMKAASDTKIISDWFDMGKCVWGELKYDGIRGFAHFNFKSLKVQSIKTYNMTDFNLELIPEIIAELEELVTWIPNQERDFFLDFEIIGKDRKSVSGQVNRVLKGTAPVGIAKGWDVCIFDIHSMDVITGIPSTRAYFDRRELLEDMFLCPEEMKHCVISQRWKIDSMNQLDEVFQKQLIAGEEGLVVKVSDGVYECKRSKLWVKMKAEKEADLEVIDIFDGSGKRSETIGGITCITSDGKLRVSVGSGFSDIQLQEIANNRQDYIGKIAKVKYNEVIGKKSSEIKSLFLPRFLEWRFDKNIANNLEDLK